MRSGSSGGEDSFRVVAELLPHVVWTAGQDGAIDYLNGRWFEYTGRDGATPVEIADVTHPEDSARTRDVWRRAVASGLSFRVEHRLRRFDGAWRWHESRGAPFRDADGRVARWVGTCTDVNDRKEAEAALREAEERSRHAQRLESLAVLAGGVAHDFNNLLVGILGNAELAIEMLPPGSRALDALAGIRAAGSRAAGLASQMLVFSGRGMRAAEPLDLGALVREAAVVPGPARGGGAMVAVDVGDEVLSIDGDRTQVREVIANLVANAVEALPEAGGTVTLRAGTTRIVAGQEVDESGAGSLPEGDYVFVEVSDDGCGMSGEARARAFDPFFTTKFPGRGLGLAVVRGVLRGHGGMARLTSEEGRGTTARVLFPRGSRPAARETEPGSAATGAGGERVILIVDDEAMVRDVTKRILERRGFRVLEASGGREALRVIDAHPEVRAVLMDLTMPGMGGEEAAREVLRAWPRVAVLLASGYSEQDVVARLAGTGLAGFVPKPFDFDALARRLASLTG